MCIGFVCRDQYGYEFVAKKHPRKELLEHFGRKRAAKMYRDDAVGQARHVGYVIAGRWITVYEIHRWEGTKR